LAGTNIRAVVFDLDDTLYPERQYVRSGYEAVGRHLEAAFGRRRARAWPMLPGEWLWRRFLAGDSARAFNALGEAFHLGLSHDQIAELIEVYRTHRPQLAPYPGVRETLEALGGSLALGVLSDGFLPAQQLKLDALRLEPYFAVVLFTEALGRDCWKPSPAGFAAVRKKLQVEHAACAYVADNPAKDFVAPNRLGWRTIQYVRANQIHASNPPAEAGRAQHVVQTDEELYQALAVD